MKSNFSSSHLTSVDPNQRKGKQLAKKIVSSHFSKSKHKRDEVWGLCTFPDGDKFATCSDDGMFRCWSASQRKCIQFINLNIDENGMMLGPDTRTRDLRTCAKLTSVDVHPNSIMAAVGCQDGTIRVVDISNMREWKQVTMFKHNKGRITVIRFSPDGKMFAVGSADRTISIYTSRDLKPISKISRHTNTITHIDWSKDGRHIHSNCLSKESLVFVASSGDYVNNGLLVLRDEDWATYTCVYGWPVQGIYRDNLNNPIVNSVDRSTKSVETYRLLAVSDEGGRVLVYRYPCLRKTADCMVGMGHAANVTGVKISRSGNHIFSTGGDDNTVLQWRITQE